jgi:aspartyl-tRNA(Asn)/glutamyl-tRNA(Gln) amidotransferase subunit A
MTDLLDQKDTTWAQGRRVTNGSLLWRDFRPPRDAVAVERARGHAVFTPLFDLALVPGISIPRGSGRDGLPVGLQIVAPRLHDRPLPALAQRAETALA